MQLRTAVHAIYALLSCSDCSARGGILRIRCARSPAVIVYLSETARENECTQLATMFMRAYCRSYVYAAYFPGVLAVSGRGSNSC